MLMPSSDRLTQLSTIYTYKEASLIFNQLELEPEVCPIITAREEWYCRARLCFSQHCIEAHWSSACTLELEDDEALAAEQQDGYLIVEFKHEMSTFLNCFVLFVLCVVFVCLFFIFLVGKNVRLLLQLIYYHIQMIWVTLGDPIQHTFLCSTRYLLLAKLQLHEGQTYGLVFK